MKIPIYCPLCGDPLLTSFGLGSKVVSKSMWKTCNKRLSHNIEFFASNEDEDVSHLTIYVEKLRITWRFDDHILYLWPGSFVKKDDAPFHPIPWFEPDLSNYKKLINKIKTYLVFS